MRLTLGLAHASLNHSGCASVKGACWRCVHANLPPPFTTEPVVMRYMPFRLIWLTMLSTVCLFNGYAENKKVHFEHLTVLDGLPENTVLTSYEDHLGFLWFGTRNGLVKYDGYDYTIYKPDPADLHSISDRQIYAICEDANGDLWVGTAQGGLNRFDRATERFTPYRHDPNDPASLANDFVNTIYIDRIGRIWAGTDDGISVLDRTTDRFTRYQPTPDNPRSLTSRIVTDILEDQRGYLWIGTWRGGLNRFDPKTETFYTYQHDPTNPNSLSHNDISQIFEDRNGTLWIATRGGGVNHFDPMTETFRAYRHDPNNPQSLSHDRTLSLYATAEEPDILWVGVGGNDATPGLNRLDTRTGIATRYVYDQYDPISLSGNTVFSILEAPKHSGRLWFGTVSGLSIYDSQAHPFNHLPHDRANPNSLSGKEILSVHEGPDGQVWVASWDGLTAYNPATDRYIRYAYDPNDPTSLQSSMVLAAHHDNQDRLWVGTWFGLDRFDTQRQAFEHIPLPQAVPNTDHILEIYEAPSDPDVLWMGTFGGLLRYDLTTDTFASYYHDPSDANSLPDHRVRFIREVASEPGVLWLIDWSDNVIRFDTKLGQTTPLANSPCLKHARSLLEDQAGDFWIGSAVYGLHKYDRATGACTTFSEEDGLPHNSVLGLMEDAQQQLWVATQRGLALFTPESHTTQFNSYGMGEDLQGNKFQYVAAHEGQDGTLYFGGNNGVVYFHPDRMVANPYVPPVVLTNMRVSNTTLPVGTNSPLQEAISVAESVTLKHWQNDVAFDFVALNYRFPQENEYAYMLENYDDTWQRVGTQRSTSYTNLAPGDYTLRVRGANNDGVWNLQGASLNLTILPPWWETPWAYLSYMLFSLMAVGTVFKWRVHSLEKRNADLEAMVSLRTTEVVQQKEAVEQAKHTIEIQADKLRDLDRMKSRFFANISHEFRTPLTLIQGPLQDLMEGTYGSINERVRGQVGVMRRNSERLLQLINQLLDLAKLESGKMALRATSGDLMAFIKGLGQSFASLAERKQIHYTFTTDPDVLVCAFDHDKLEHVFSNLLSNAFKFTPVGGRISVNIQQPDADTISIRIEDTGTGIPEDALPHIFNRFYQADTSATRAHEGSGIGLALTHELVALHGGSVTAESTVGVGSVFTVVLPVVQEEIENGEIGDLVDVDTKEHGEGEHRGTTDEQILQTDHEHQSQEAAASTTAPVVLIVEDHADVRAYLRSHLVGTYRVEEAVNGVEGLDRARTLEPDLIISDVMMPEMDGYALCRAIKTDETLNHIPVILLTARASEESKVEGLETGADDYIYKPFRATELLTRAENLIEIRRLLRRRYSREVVAVQATEVRVSSAESLFLERVQAVVETEISNSLFGTDWLASEIGLSPRQLRRKLKDLTGLTTAGYIRSLRLQRAAQLLEERSGTVSEVAYAVGFQDPKHFSKLFRQVFGVSPSEVRNGKRVVQPIRNAH